MTREEAKARLVALNAAIAGAVLLIRAEQEILDQYLAEEREFNTLAPILDPTLWTNPERRQAAELTTPVYRAARELVRVHAEMAIKLREIVARGAA